MNFEFAHNSFNVLNLEKSIKFYKDALNLDVVSEYNAPDGSFKLVFLGDNKTPHTLELTWIKGRTEPYNLGENEFHLALKTKDMKKSLELHKQMNCVCYENTDMGIYFINDPDGYWIEIVPQD